MTTTAAGSPSSFASSDRGLTTCVGTPGCTGTVSGEIAVGLRGTAHRGQRLRQHLPGREPNAFTRTAFIEALGAPGRHGDRPPVAANPASLLPATQDYAADTRVAAYESAPTPQIARLVLKVSLNLGANLSLSLFGLTEGERTIARRTGRRAPAPHRAVRRRRRPVRLPHQRQRHP